MAYDFRDRLDLVSTGPLTNAMAIAAFPDADGPLTISGNIANYYSVINEPLALNGKAFRCLYPANVFGQQCWIAIPKTGPGVASNLEFKVRFNAPWQFGNDPTAMHLGGKFGMSIDLDDAIRGYRCQAWWYGSGSRYNSPGFIPVLQQDVTGAEYMPVNYSAPIVVGQVYKLRFQAFGGPAGFAKVWLNDVLLGSVARDCSDISTANGTHWYRFSGFAGGAAQYYAPTVNQWVDHWDVHIWTEDPVAPQMSITQGTITLT